MMLSVSYSVDVRSAKALHPARTILQASCYSIRAHPPAITHNHFPSSLSVRPIILHIMDCKQLGISLSLFLLSTISPIGMQDDVPASRQRMDESQIFEQVPL
jgi:hypothetical protein